MYEMNNSVKNLNKLVNADLKHLLKGNHLAYT